MREGRAGREKKKKNSQRLWLIQRKSTLAGRNITRYCRVISGMKPPGYPSEEVLQVCLWRVSVSLCLCLCVSVSMPVHLGVFVRGSLFAIIRSSSKLIFSALSPPQLLQIMRLGELSIKCRVASVRERDRGERLIVVCSWHGSLAVQRPQYPIFDIAAATYNNNPTFKVSSY